MKTSRMLMMMMVMTMTVMTMMVWIMLLLLLLVLILILIVTIKVPMLIRMLIGMVKTLVTNRLLAILVVKVPQAIFRSTTILMKRTGTTPTMLFVKQTIQRDMMALMMKSTLISVRQHMLR